MQVIFFSSKNRMMKVILPRCSCRSFFHEAGYINISLLLYVFINAVITLINFMLDHLFMKLTLVIKISFSHLWSFFVVDQFGIYDSGITLFYYITYIFRFKNEKFCFKPALRDYLMLRLFIRLTNF